MPMFANSKAERDKLKLLEGLFQRYDDPGTNRSDYEFMVKYASTLGYASTAGNHVLFMLADSSLSSNELILARNRLLQILEADPDMFFICKYS
jgi:hypothetical protein